MKNSLCVRLVRYFHMCHTRASTGPMCTLPHIGLTVACTRVFIADTCGRHIHTYLCVCCRVTCGCHVGTCMAQGSEHTLCLSLVSPLPSDLPCHRVSPGVAGAPLLGECCLCSGRQLKAVLRQAPCAGADPRQVPSYTACPCTCITHLSIGSSHSPLAAAD